MRTLHVDPDPGWRGGEQQVLYLVEGLRERGLEPVLAAHPAGELARRAVPLGLRVVPFRARGDLDLRAALALRRLGRGVDLVHLHTGRAHGVGRLAWAGGRRPAVVVSRRVDFPVKGGIAGTWKYGAGVDAYVAVSRRVAAVLAESGVPAARVRVVHSGVDSRRFAIPRDDAGLRAELGLPAGARLALFVGALVSHKAPWDLVDAAALLPPEARVLFAGDGALRGDLLARAAERGVGERIHLLGRRADVPRLLRSVDVFVLPSHLEGLGTSVLDAMAAGTPVVAARAGGIPEMVEDGASGLLVPPGEPEELAGAIARVLGDPALAGRLAAGGRARVEAFSRERMVDGTLRVYEDILRRRRSGAEEDRRGEAPPPGPGRSGP